jgi:hypothetical protein
MAIYKRGSTYHYDFILDGVRRQGSTKLKNRRDAQHLVDELRVKWVGRHNGFVTEVPTPKAENQDTDLPPAVGSLAQPSPHQKSAAGA